MKVEISFDSETLGSISLPEDPSMWHEGWDNWHSLGADHDVNVLELNGIMYASIYAVENGNTQWKTVLETVKLK